MSEVKLIGVYSADVDALQSQLDALREELTKAAYMRTFWAESAAELDKRLEAAEQRNAILFDLLDTMDKARWSYPLPKAFQAQINAALKPTESVASEPQCLLCLDAKTVPGNISGGFVKDCPDCCAEEG